SPAPHLVSSPRVPRPISTRLAATTAPRIRPVSKGAKMARGILGVVAGLLVWAAVATVGGIVLRGTWTDYARVADAMPFTLPMMIARLTIGAVATIVAGRVTALIGQSTLSRLIPGLLLLLIFIPQHITLWQKFPIWYHLTFLLSLVPLTYLGGTRITRE